MIKLTKITSITGKILTLLILTLILLETACKKNNPPEAGNILKKMLSKNAPDYRSRLIAIKEKFYANKLDEKLKPNINQKLVWTPDWEHPKMQVVNDSVSYVFYPLIGYYNKNNKLQKVKELGGKMFLIVKNEKDYYRGFYYKPLSENLNTDTYKEISIVNFTGNLILTNLETKSSFLIRYNDGKVVDDFTKEQKIASIKKMSSIPTSSYWGQICHQEIRRCTFVSDGYSQCGGGFEVIYSEYCQWPSSHCGVSFYLTDSSEETVCQDVWFPDPPTDPTDPSDGGETGNPLQEQFDQFNQRIYLDELDPCAKSVLQSLMYQSEGSAIQIIQKFSGEVPGYTWALLNGPLEPNLNALTQKTNLGALTTIDKNKYTNGTDLALARTILHEAVHAYLVSYFQNNPILAQLSYPDMLVEWEKAKHPSLNTIQHIEMTIEFKNDIAIGLQEYGDLHGYTFSNAAEKQQFYSDMAWGGLEATPAYQALSTADKNRIQDTIQAEQYGTDRNGSYKSAKGTPSGC